jgi:hypothetical protein
MHEVCEREEKTQNGFWNDSLENHYEIFISYFCLEILENQISL